MSFSGLPLLTVVTYEDVQPGARWTPEHAYRFSPLHVLSIQRSKPETSHQVHKGVGQGCHGNAHPLQCHHQGQAGDKT